MLTVPGCSNRDGAVALAARVCAELGSAAEVGVSDIAEQPAAEQARFLGSPTIRVDGQEIEPGAQADRGLPRLIVRRVPEEVLPPRSG